MVWRWCGGGVCWDGGYERLRLRTLLDGGSVMEGVCRQQRRLDNSHVCDHTVAIRYEHERDHEMRRVKAVCRDVITLLP